jgi:hypothetical protein
METQKYIVVEMKIVASDDFDIEKLKDAIINEEAIGAHAHVGSTIFNEDGSIVGEVKSVKASIFSKGTVMNNNLMDVDENGSTVLLSVGEGGDAFLVVRGSENSNDYRFTPDEIGLAKADKIITAINQWVEYIKKINPSIKRNIILKTPIEKQKDLLNRWLKLLEWEAGIGVVNLAEEITKELDELEKYEEQHEDKI